MLERSRSPSPDSHALVALSSSESGALAGWQPILQASNQVVLYNPTNHALSIRRSSLSATSSGLPRRARPPAGPATCPYCCRPFDFTTHASGLDTHDEDPLLHSRAPNYFQLLEAANVASSRPSTPPPLMDSSVPDHARGTSAFSPDAMAEGYFKAFFKEERRLGMGASGSVYLCQHHLDGNPLGHFAVKKIAVGESHSYLLQTLREVRLLERLRHPNIVTYHHAWLETYQFSSFGPKVPTLHLLMQWAEGGSLDDFIAARLGHVDHDHDGASPSSDGPADTRSARIRAFRARRASSHHENAQAQARGQNVVNEPDAPWTAVHLLSAEEVRSLLGDVVEGLAFLHDKSILHLDLKPGNVLLTWDEGKLIPRAMLSDFGTSRDMISSLARSGNTGTLEYTAPESLQRSPVTGELRQIDSKVDMWSLGMVLHKLLFFKLPWRAASDAEPSPLSALPSTTGGEDNTAHPRHAAPGPGTGPARLENLEREVLAYSGYKPAPGLPALFESRRLPRAYLVLLEGLLSVQPSARPPCERVLHALREGRFDPILSPDEHAGRRAETSLIPVPVTLRGRSSPEAPRAMPPARSQSHDRRPAPASGSASVSISAVHDEKRPAAGERSQSPRDAKRVRGRGRWRAFSLVFGRGAEYGVEEPSRLLLVRATKSSILVAKVYSLVLLSQGQGWRNHVFAPAPFPLLFALGLAVADTLSNGWQTSAVLGIAHLVVLKWAGWV